MPLLRLMLHRAPKLTARKFYAPLNERSSFDGLCVAARLIGNSVRRQKFIVKPYSTVSVDSQGVGSGDSCTYYVSAAPIRVGAYNEIEKTPVFSSIPSLES